jgi:hypothetical protein
MESFMSTLGGRRAKDAVAAAQDVMYDAWDQSSKRARVDLAHKALAISPLCADAYVLLAEEEAKSAEEALELFRKGVEVGEQALGPAGFKEGSDPKAREFARDALRANKHFLQFWPAARRPSRPRAVILLWAERTRQHTTSKNGASTGTPLPVRSTG